MASRSAAAFVVPVAEKYATNVFAFIDVIHAAQRSAKKNSFFISIVLIIFGLPGKGKKGFRQVAVTVRVLV